MIFGQADPPKVNVRKHFDAAASLLEQFSQEGQGQQPLHVLQQRLLQGQAALGWKGLIETNHASSLNRDFIIVSCCVSNFVKR
jgi:hypothetical protein